MIKGTWMEPVWWFVYAAVPITALCLGLYAVGQQVFRQEANDPQIVMAEDAAARLNGGEVPAALLDRNAPLVDIAASLAPWLAVYDSAGMPLEASAMLDNAPPQPPLALFTTAWRLDKTYKTPVGDETRITWQPRQGVRQSLIIVRTKGDRFVIAGGSLRESERRITILSMSVFIGWIVTLGATFVLSFIGWFFLRTAK